MTRAERVQRAESTLREVSERLEAGRLWASDLDRLAASASVLDDFTPKDPAWPLRERFLASSCEVLSLFRDGTKVQSVADTVKALRAHVPIYVSRSRDLRVTGVVIAAALAVVMAISRSPLCAFFCFLPALFFIRLPPVAVSRAMVVFSGRAIEPREIAGITLSFDARFTFLVLQGGERVLIAPGEFVQALREIGVERV
ncbi:MAG: hypothetical protein ABTQ32_04000 [Myxococcaceae bacterium]